MAVAPSEVTSALTAADDQVTPLTPVVLTFGKGFGGSGKLSGGGFLQENKKSKNKNTLLNLFNVLI